MRKLLIISLLALCPVAVLAQDPPDVSQGLNPIATYHGSDIDLIDTITGRLNLHIPLIVDHSQRGKLNFTYSLDFSGQTWSVNSSNLWTLAKGTNLGVGLVIDGHLSGVQNCLEPLNVRTCGYSATALEVGADDGSVYPLSTTTGGGETFDGSGIMSTTNSGGVAVLINADGIQSGQTSYNINTGAWTRLIEDSNGNEMTFSSNYVLSPTTPY